MNTYVDLTYTSGSGEGGFSSIDEPGNLMENDIKLEAQTQQHINTSA